MKNYNYITNFLTIVNKDKSEKKCLKTVVPSYDMGRVSALKNPMKTTVKKVAQQPLAKPKK